MEIEELPDPRGVMLGMLNTRRIELGETAWQEECRKWGLSDEQLNLASRGMVASPVVMQLSSLLNIPATGVLQDATFDRNRIDEEALPDRKREMN